jgi:hypothetical protein
VLTALTLLHVAFAPQVRLVEDVDRPLDYERMTRAELHKELLDLEQARPGLTWPILGVVVGGAGAALSAFIFWSMFSTPYGLAVYSAVVLVVVFVASVATVAAGVGGYALNKPKRDAIGERLDEIRKAEHEGRCRSVPGQPCEMDPQGPPPAPPPRSPFVPQVEGPAPSPSFVLARF